MELRHKISRERKIKTELIEEKKYSYIIENMPFCCVDLILKNDKDEVLLIRRKEEPLKNQWCLPGGRVLRDELIEEAAVRKSKEELGINSKFKKLVCIYQNLFDKSEFNNNGTHVLDFVCVIEWDKNQKIKLDGFHSEYKFFKSIPSEITHDFVKFAFEEEK